MTPDPVFAAPVESLQLMLRTISFVDPRIPRLIPDGIYTDQTASAVSVFQSVNNLPVTGTVDEATWERIVLEYELALDLLTIAQAPVVHFPVGLAIVPGQSHPHMYLAQGMLRALRQIYSDVPAIDMTGINDADTERALRWIQEAAQLPVTGVLDKRTWNALCRLYRLHFDRIQEPSQG